MGFVDAVKAFYRNYAKFSGRASRSEYWWIQLFFILLYVVMIAGVMLFGQVSETLSMIWVGLIMLIILASIVPSFSIIARRLHDVDKSGWFYFIALIPFGIFYVLYLFIIKGTDGPNRFGPDPLGHDATVFN